MTQNIFTLLFNGTYLALGRDGSQLSNSKLLAITLVCLTMASPVVAQTKFEKVWESQNKSYQEVEFSIPREPVFYGYTSPELKKDGAPRRSKETLSRMSDEELIEMYQQYLNHMSHHFLPKQKQDFILVKLKSLESMSIKVRREFLISELLLENMRIIDRDVFIAKMPKFHVVTYLCEIGFSDPDALANTIDESKWTFAVWSKRGVYPPQECDSSNPADCKIYEQDCGPMGYANVEETPFNAYAHYHLGFSPAEDFCISDSGDGFGRVNGSNCDTIDHKNTDRTALTHVPSHTLKLWLRNPATDHDGWNFGVRTFRLLADVNTSVYFRKSDGSWWWWESLGPNWWDTSAWTWDITEMQFHATDGETRVIEIDDLVLLKTLVSISLLP